MWLPPNFGCPGLGREIPKNEAAQINVRLAEVSQSPDAASDTQPGFLAVPFLVVVDFFQVTLDPIPTLANSLEYHQDNGDQEHIKKRAPGRDVDAFVEFVERRKRRTQAEQRQRESDGDGERWPRGIDPSPHPTKKPGWRLRPSAEPSLQSS
jgi:hypothetical protein